MNRAIVNKNDWSNSNTVVEYNSNTDCSAVYLHNNRIATYDHNLKAVKLNSGGYQTVTTKSRLNAILSQLITGASVFQRDFIWFLNYNNQTHNFFDGMILSQGEVI